MNRNLVIGVVVSMALLAGAAVVLSEQAPRPAPSAGTQDAPAPTSSSGGAPQLGGVLGTIAAGVTLQNLVGNVAEAVGGQGAGAVARVAPLGIGLGVIAGSLAGQGVAALGAGKEVSREVGVVATAGVIAGAPVAVGVAGLQLAGKGAQAVLGLVAGEGVSHAVSNAVSQFDPFKSGSVANTLVSGVASGVKAVGNFFGSIF